MVKDNWARLCLARDNKRIFTPVAQLRKKSVNPSAQSWLESKSGDAGEAPKPVQQTQRDFKMVAGDNLAEAAFSAIKRAARRMNVAGAGSKKCNGPSIHGWKEEKQVI